MAAASVVAGAGAAAGGAFDATWEKLRTYVGRVLRGEDTKSITAMSVHQMVYKMSIARMSERLYRELAAYLESEVLAIVARLEALQGDIITAYRDAWQPFIAGAEAIHSLFHQLNDSWIKRAVEDMRTGVVDASSHDSATSVYPVYTLWLVTWREKLFFTRADDGRPIASRIVNKLVFQILNSINRDRNGEEINRDLLWTVVGSFLKMWLRRQRPLEVYRSELEEPYLVHLSEYFDGESAHFLSQNSVADYLRMVNRRLVGELDRARTILLPASLEKIYFALKEALVWKHASRLHGEFVPFLQADRFDELRLLYDLLRGINIQQYAADALAASAHTADAAAAGASGATGVGNNVASALGVSSPLAGTPPSASAAPGTGSGGAREVTPAPQADDGRTLHEGSGGHDGIAPLVEPMRTFVEEVVRARLGELSAAQLEDPQQFIGEVLVMLRRFDRFLTECFASDKRLTQAVHQALRATLNDAAFVGGRRAAELLARYTDGLLRRTKQTTNEADLEARLDEAIAIFAHLEERDVFQRYYQKTLARRLISGLSVSNDAEASMVARLKRVDGYEYTAKLKRMFTDIQLSEDVNAAFANFVASSQIDLAGVSCSVHVLTQGSWPSQTGAVVAFAPPREIARCIEGFELYYRNAHAGRVLTWLHPLCRGDMRTHYLSGKDKELTVSGFQMGVLCAFNSGTALSVATLQEMTQLPTAELERTLGSLIKFKLLRLDGAAAAEADDAGGAGGAGDDDDEAGGGGASAPALALGPETIVHLNLAFTNKRHKLKVTGTAMKETPTERKETLKGVDDDRKLFIQAAIVRVMKARKQMQHNVLVAAVTEIAQARFAPKVADIKHAIEHLIDKQYIVREENQRNVYNYLA